MTHAAAARFVLATCFLVLLFNGGARFAIGLLLPLMEEELAWTRSELSLNVTVFMVLFASVLLFVGVLVDRVGAGTVLGAGVLLSALGLGAMGFIEHPWQALLLYGVIFALGSAGTSVTPVGVLLSRWYPHRLGMANSIAISGMGLGQLLVIAALAAQLAHIGWRGSFLALGAATLVCILPVVLVARRTAVPAADSGREAGTLREALASRRLWMLPRDLCDLRFPGLPDGHPCRRLRGRRGRRHPARGQHAGVHGADRPWRRVADRALLNDRFGPVLPTVICFVLRTVLFAVLLVSREPAVIVGMVLLFGVTFWITAPLTVVFGREIAAMSLLGTVTGLITMVHHSAGGLGALVGGAIFDAYGSYDAAFLLMLVLSVAALAPHPRPAGPSAGGP